MIIRISDIEDNAEVKGAIEGLRFQGGEEEADVMCAGPVEYELLLRKSGNIVGLKGPVRCTLTLTCSKCMERFSMPVETLLDIEIAPKTLMPSASELELKGEDLDTYYYEGDEIDIEPFLYDEIMLSVPIKPLCRDDCKGLCEVCGGNRNYEECRCGSVPRTLLGEKLKSFLN